MPTRSASNHAQQRLSLVPSGCKSKSARIFERHTFVRFALFTGQLLMQLLCFSATLDSAREPSRAALEHRVKVRDKLKIDYKGQECLAL